MLQLYCIVEIQSLKARLETQRKRTEELEKESKTLNSGKKTCLQNIIYNFEIHGTTSFV